MSEVLCAFDMPLMMFGKYTRKKTTEWKIDKNGKKRPSKQVTVYDEMVRGKDLGLFPTVNHMYRKMRGGKQLTEMAKDRLVDWRMMTEIYWEAAGQTEPIKGKNVYVDAYFILPDHKIRDVSNVLKLLMDALEGVVYENDYHALPRIMDMRVVPGKARCYIEIRECDSGAEWLEKVDYNHE